MEPVACFGLGVVRGNHGQICLCLLVFGPRCSKLRCLGRLCGHCLRAIGSLLRSDRRIPRLPRCRFSLDGCFLSCGGGSHCPSGNRCRLVRGNRISFRRTPTGEQLGRRGVLPLSALRHAVQTLRLRATTLAQAEEITQGDRARCGAACHRRAGAGCLWAFACPISSQSAAPKLPRRSRYAQRCSTIRLSGRHGRWIGDRDELKKWWRRDHRRDRHRCRDPVPGWRDQDLTHSVGDLRAWQTLWCRRIAGLDRRSTERTLIGLPEP
jgi:hypothetical protein